MKTRWKIALVFALLFAVGIRWVVHDVSRNSTFLRAAYAGQRDVVEKMLADGEKVDTKDPRYGGTALIYAAQQGHIDIVKLLLDNHADINAMSKLGQTALAQAAFHKHLDVVKLLLEHGAKLDERLRPGVLKSVEGNPELIKMLPPEQEKAPETKTP